MRNSIRRHLAVFGLVAAALGVLAPTASATFDVDVVRGCDSLDMGDYVRAQQYFARAVAARPTYPLGHLGLGIVALQSGAAFGREAELEFASAGALPQALAGLGYVALAQGDYDLAQLCFSDADAVCGSQMPDVLLAKGYAALCSGDASAAIAAESAGRTRQGNPALANAIAAERHAMNRNGATASVMSDRALEDLDGQMVHSRGMIRLNPPRGVADGMSPLSEWAPTVGGRPASGPLTIAAPGEGGEVSGTALIHVLLPPNIGGAQPYVSVHIDGKLLRNYDRRPYRFEWDTTRVAPGTHTIRVSVRRNLLEDPVATAERTCVVREEGVLPQLGPEYGSAFQRLTKILASPTLAPWWRDALSALSAGSLVLPPPPSGQGAGFVPRREIETRPQPEPLPRRDPETTPDGPGAMGGVPAAYGAGGPSVALYFDDGPHPFITPAILAILKEKNVKASFFLVGSQCEKYPDLVRLIAREGHTVGAHSYSHVNLTNLYPAELETEIAGCAHLIGNILADDRRGRPAPVRFFRCPGGNVNAAVNQSIRRAGLIALDEGIYNTWGYMELTPDEIVDLTLQSPHDIILLHNGEDKSVFALPRLIDELRARGYAFATADQRYPAE